MSAVLQYPSSDTSVFNFKPEESVNSFRSPWITKRHKPVIESAEVVSDFDIDVPKSAKIRLPNPQRPAPNVRFILLEKWDGIVLNVDEAENDFSVRLERESDNQAEDAVFSLDELSEEQQRYVEPGAKLVWTIGYREEAGTRRRVSEIYFRRFPAISDDEWTKAEAKASELGEKIGW